MNTIKMVVLDMAGTTVNEHNVVYKTLQKAITNYGIDISLDKVLEIGAGKEKFQAIKDIVNTINLNTDVNVEAIFSDFKTLLEQAYNTLEVSPVKGVEDVLLKLKTEDIKVVLNTGYNSIVANNLLQKLKWNLGTHYDLLITADDVDKGRPHPDMILKAMHHFNIDNPLQVLKAGDSAIDIEEGKNANCGITIGVLSGAQTKEQLMQMNPTYILESLATLRTVI
ncbi:phosphonatase-like hydrolase [Pontimicrobium sp. MEBiC01747]